MTPAASRRGRADRDRPGPRLLRARRSGTSAGRACAKPTRASWARPGSPGPTRRSSSARLVVGQLGQFGLGLGVEEDRLGRRDQRRAARSLQASSASSSDVHVEHVDERLGRQQVQLAQVGQVDPAWPRRRTTSCRRRALLRPPAAASAVASFSGSLANLVSLCQPGQRLLQRLQVGQDQLGDRSSRCRRSGRPSPSTWLTSGSLKTRTTWQIASVSRMWPRNWLPRPCPSARPADQPGDVDEPHRGGHDLGRVVQLGQLGQPRVGHADDADVGLDRRERVVRGQHARSWSAR